MALVRNRLFENCSMCPDGPAGLAKGTRFSFIFDFSSFFISFYGLFDLYSIFNRLVSIQSVFSEVIFSGHRISWPLRRKKWNNSWRLNKGGTQTAPSGWRRRKIPRFEQKRMKLRCEKNRKFQFESNDVITNYDLDVVKYTWKRYKWGVIIKKILATRKTQMDNKNHKTRMKGLFLVNKLK